MKNHTPFLKKIILSIFVFFGLIACKNEAAQVANESQVVAPVALPKSIKLEVKRLSTISDNQWDRIEEKDYDFSSEGGTLKYYYEQRKLRKIMTMSFGEMGKAETNYFLNEDGELMAVWEGNFQYNRPIYYDSMAMINNEDTAFFQIEKTDTVLIQAYFDKGKIIDMTNNIIAEISAYQMEDENKRFIENFNSIKPVK